METEILSLIIGIIVGIVFSMLNLPLPAPPKLAGVLGIVGIWIGFKIVELMVKIL